MKKSLHGTIHGKTIQLAEDPGIAEGQQVEVQMKVVSPSQTWGEGIRRSAGGWANHPELDVILQTIQRQRKLERPSQMGHE